MSRIGASSAEISRSIDLILDAIEMRELGLSKSAFLLLGGESHFADT